MNYAPASYDQAPSVEADPREIEAWALLKAARRLDNARLNPEDVEELRASLRQNQMLWTIFQAAVSEDACPLPLEIRKSVLQLSQIIDKRTFACFGDLDPEHLPPLIDINRNVALGLMGNPGDGIEGSQSTTVKTLPEIDTEHTALNLDC